MYKKVNITENHLRVLSLYTQGFDQMHFIREVERLLSLSPRTAQLILDDLESKGALESALRGKVKMYRLKGGTMAQEYLILAEEHKRVALLSSEPLLREVVAKALPHLSGIAFIFGSRARGDATPRSDLDLFVAGAADIAALEKVGATYGLTVNVKRYPESAFFRGLRSDPLVIEVLRSHVMLLGADRLVRMVA
jgi:predicted nucleotidyltransferase